MHIHHIYIYRYIHMTNMHVCNHIYNYIICLAGMTAGPRRGEGKRGEGMRVLLTEILLLRIAQQGIVRPISISG